MKYQKEIKNISDKYYSLMEKIENDWSVLYNLGDYTGKLSNQFEKKCLEDIAYYEKMREIDIKYGDRIRQIFLHLSDLQCSTNEELITKNLSIYVSKQFL